MISLPAPATLGRQTSTSGNRIEARRHIPQSLAANALTIAEVSMCGALRLLAHVRSLIAPPLMVWRRVVSIALIAVIAVGAQPDRLERLRQRRVAFGF